MGGWCRSRGDGRTSPCRCPEERTEPRPRTLRCSRRPPCWRWSDTSTTDLTPPPPHSTSSPGVRGSAARTRETALTRRRKEELRDDMRSSIVMSYESWTSCCGWRICTPGQPGRPARAAAESAWSGDQGAGARVCNLCSTSPALCPGGPTRAGAAAGPGAEGRLYGESPGQRATPSSGARARRRVQSERAREPRSDHLSWAAAPGHSWGHPGPVRGRLFDVGRHAAGCWPRRRLIPARHRALAGPGHDQTPGRSGGSPHLRSHRGRASPCAEAPAARAAESTWGARGHRSSPLPGGPRVPGGRGDRRAARTVPGPPATLDRGRGAARLHPRGRSTRR